MKPDHLTAQVTAESLDVALENALVKLNCTRAGADIEVLRVRQSGRPVTIPPFNFNKRRILHDLFRQTPAFASRSKGHEGDCKVVVLQKRG
jgi:hypothetical protein